jgi:hypothetical protein
MKISLLQRGILMTLEEAGSWHNIAINSLTADRTGF